MQRLNFSYDKPAPVVSAGVCAPNVDPIFSLREEWAARDDPCSREKRALATGSIASGCGLNRMAIASDASARVIRQYKRVV